MQKLTEKEIRHCLERLLMSRLMIDKSNRNHVHNERSPLTASNGWQAPTYTLTLKP